MKKIFIVLVALAVISCARLSLRTQEPIKVDINMRIDVYQHVVEDVESIEDEVYEEGPEQSDGNQVYEEEAKQSNLFFGSGLAYAAERPSGRDGAIKRRRMRIARLNTYFIKGYVGENREAHLEMRVEDLPAELEREIKSTIKEENRDREKIYRAVAKKRGADVSEVRKVFFQDHYKRAPAGSWFEVQDKEKARYIWKKK